MKIALIGPVYPFRGGIAHYMTSLVHALDKVHQVRVFSYKRQFPALLYPGKSDKDPSKGVTKVEAEFVLDPINPLSWFRTCDEMLSWQPDLVILNWWVTIWSFAYRSIARRAKGAGVPVLYIVHNVLPHEPHFLDKHLARIALRYGDGFILHSSSQQERLASLLPKANHIQLPHPVYNPFDAPGIDREEARTRLQLPQEVPLFLFFGIVRAYKGLHVLIEAAAILKNRGKLPHFLVGGEFWHGKDTALRSITEFGLNSQFHIHDRYIPNEEVSWFFIAANVYVAPYVAGSQSGALALALGYGLPAIASETISGSVELPADASVDVVPEDDAVALADQMEKFVDDVHLFNNELQPVEGNWKMIVEAILNIIEVDYEK